MVNELSVVELLRFDYILYAHSEDSDQTERMRSQISAFDVCIGIGHLAWHGSSLRNWIHVVDFSLLPPRETTFIPLIALLQLHANPRLKRGIL